MPSPASLVSSTVQPPRRGAKVQTPGGGVGWYVGTTDRGLEHVAYSKADFAPMCRAFDAAQARTARRAAS